MPSHATKKTLCVDLALSQRLERAEGLANARHIEAKQRAVPGTDSRWISVGGTFAMFDAPQSPLTQTFGLGVFETPTDAELDEIEAFFADHRAPVFHEISPVPDQALIGRLCARGYHPIEFTNLLCSPVTDLAPIAINPRLTVRQSGPQDQEAYTKLAAEGWQLPPEFSSFFDELGKINSHNPHLATFLVELDGQPVGCGGLCFSDDVALIAGDCTLPESRGHGAQLALIAARIDYAKARGVDLLMMGALPGSTSQKNGQRAGLQIAYTRIKWQKS